MQKHLTIGKEFYKLDIETSDLEKGGFCMSVTIKEVAALAGVSPSTVSRTCKDHPSISRQTKEKVRRAMDQLGYEPNFQASSLATQNSRTIGIILPPSERETYENAFYLEAVRGISILCNQRQYINTVITGKDETELLQVIKTTVRNGLPEGFIILYSREQDPVVNYLYEEGLLYVLVGKAFRNANQTIYVDNDNVLAGKEAAQYLISLGHRKIGYLSGDHSLLYTGDRKSGYMLALAENNIPFRPEYCVETSFLPGAENPVLRELLSRSDRPTAFVASDDILASYLERLCVEMNIAVPKELSVISFNNSLFARMTKPPLTSIDINSFQLGSEAAAQMISHIENPNLLATKTIVPHYIVERESCIETV